jgi:glutathione peroxidase
MTRPTRRDLLATAGLLAAAGPAAAAETLAWDFSFPNIDGGTLDLATYKGHALMVVNTASFCGFVYQFEALEKLAKTRAAAGLTVIGVPSQDFNQEADSNAKVKAFCDATFGVDFPMAAISKVKGDDAAPFYRWVKKERNWEPSWNFNKVVIGRDGRILACFGSGDEPDGLRVQNAINAALAATA